MTKQEEFVKISFKINDSIEATSLLIPASEEKLCFDLTNNDGFTSTYIKQLAQCGSINGPIFKIYRVTEEEGDILIHDDAGDELVSQIIDDNNVEDTSHIKKISEWDDTATTLMLDRYEEYLPQVGPTKQFKTKKIMWKQIASDLEKEIDKHFTYIQVENRYKALLKRKKDSILNNSTSGAVRTPIPYEEELNKISAIDDSIVPQVLRSSNCVTYPKNCNNTPSISGYNTDSNQDLEDSTKSTKQKKEKKKTIEAILQDIFERKEENRERRHKEKMELLRELFNQSKKK